jgi:hypothetical protein
MVKFVLNVATVASWVGLALAHDSKDVWGTVALFILGAVGLARMVGGLKK